MKVIVEYDMPDDFKPNAEDCENYCFLLDEPVNGYCAKLGDKSCYYQDMLKDGELKEVRDLELFT